MFNFKKTNIANPDSLIYILISKLFTLWASRSHRICIVAARVRQGRFAVDVYSFMGRCLAYRRPQLVNNPDRTIREV